MVRNAMLLLVGAVLLSGCATVSHAPLSAESSARLGGKSLVETRYEKPNFTAFTPGRAAFGLIGAAAMVSEGNEIVNANNIPDPAQRIATGLSERLSKARSMVTVPNQGRVAANDEVQTLVSTYPEAGYLLDIKTLGWMFNYYPSQWSRYKVTYTARMRLIDASTKDVVAETACNTVQGDDSNPPTKDQLLENGAALLKRYLEQAADACVDVLARDALKV
jgi:predicted small secreted protein